jgi:hypothetical protein
MKELCQIASNDAALCLNGELVPAVEVVFSVLEPTYSIDLDAWLEKRFDIIKSPSVETFRVTVEKNALNELIRQLLRIRRELKKRRAAG